MKNEQRNDDKRKAVTRFNGYECQVSNISRQKSLNETMSKKQQKSLRRPKNEVIPPEVRRKQYRTHDEQADSKFYKKMYIIPNVNLNHKFKNDSNKFDNAEIRNYHEITVFVKYTNM